MEETKKPSNYGKFKIMLNKENFNNYHRNYYHEKKNYFTCECGCQVINIKAKINRHNLSKKHINILKELNN